MQLTLVREAQQQERDRNAQSQKMNREILKDDRAESEMDIKYGYRRLDVYHDEKVKTFVNLVEKTPPSKDTIHHLEEATDQQIREFADKVAADEKALQALRESQMDKAKLAFELAQLEAKQEAERQRLLDRQEQDRDERAGR